VKSAPWKFIGAGRKALRQRRRPHRISSCLQQHIKEIEKASLGNLEYSSI
jgi:hypothetical protein